MIDLNSLKRPFDVLTAGIDAIARRTSPKISDAIMRVRLDGRVIGHCRMRSFVEENCGERDDRLKIYGLSTFLSAEGMTGARTIHSGSGLLVAVEADLPQGRIVFDSPPGLKAPSRRRARRQRRRMQMKG